MDRSTYDRMRLLQDHHWWFRGRRTILSGLIGELTLPHPARVLEAGCGPGGNLTMLRRFGQVTGLEPDEASRTYASQRMGVRVEGGLLPDTLPFEPASFDLVCAFDVIEHVDEDAATVAALGRLLKVGGYLATTVPAQPWMWGQHDALHHHKRRYRLRDYRRLFDAAGLTILKASYFNTLLFAPIAAIRLAKLALRSTSADDDALPPEPVNALLAGLFGAELHWLKHAPLPIGVSIVVIAQRPA